MKVVEVPVTYNGRSHSVLSYFSSDDHFGGDDFHERRWTRDHQEAMDRGAMIWKIGDFFGAITHLDKRFSHATVKAEYKRDYYVNAVIEAAVEMWTPFVNSLYGLGHGNHEVTFMLKNGIDLTALLIYRLNQLRDKTLPPIEHLGYCGVIRYKGRELKTDSGLSRNSWMYTFAYHHGQEGGAGAPVTEGIIAAKRLKDNFDGIDALVFGHVHKNWSVRNQRFYCDKGGNIRVREVRLLCCGTYQRSYSDFDDGNTRWGERRGFPPASMGGIYHTITVQRKYTSEMEVLSRVEH